MCRFDCLPIQPLNELQTVSSELFFSVFLFFGQEISHTFRLHITRTKDSQCTILRTCFLRTLAKGLETKRTHRNCCCFLLLFSVDLLNLGSLKERTGHCNSHVLYLMTAPWKGKCFKMRQEAKKTEKEVSQAVFTLPKCVYPSNPDGD